MQPLPSWIGGGEPGSQPPPSGEARGSPSGSWEGWGSQLWSSRAVWRRGDATRRRESGCHMCRAARTLHMHTAHTHIHVHKLSHTFMHTQTHTQAILQPCRAHKLLLKSERFCGHIHGVVCACRSVYHTSTHAHTPRDFKWQHPPLHSTPKRPPIPSNPIPLAGHSSHGLATHLACHLYSHPPLM